MVRACWAWSAGTHAKSGTP